jgi:hypothetical protein
MGGARQQKVYYKNLIKDDSKKNFEKRRKMRQRQLNISAFLST